MDKPEDKKNKRSNSKEMSFWEHLEELRWCLIKSVVSIIGFTLGSFPFSNYLLDFLTYPNNHLQEPAELIFLKPTGMLIVRMEIALAVGLILSLPVIIYQIWNFVSPGLHSHEKKYVIPSIIFTTFCFLLGSIFAYTILIPTVLPFLFGMGTDTISATININEYMSFVLRLILISGLIFELPVLSFILSRLGLITPGFMRKYRRYSIVLFFIFAAIVTPPDPLSQSMMAIPLVLLYEISIWISHIGYRKKRKADKEWEEEYQQKNDMDKSDAS